MKSKIILLAVAAASISLVQGAAAEELQIQASFYPYYDFTRNVAGTTANTELFLPLGVEAHDWEPSISKVRTLADTDVFIYNGLGIETYIDRLAESDDQAHVTFVKASEGLVLISTSGVDERIRMALEEYESDHYTAEEAVEAITSILDGEDIREILEEFKSGELTTTEALSSILELSGDEQAGHDDHDHMSEKEHMDDAKQMSEDDHMSEKEHMDDTKHMSEDDHMSETDHDEHEYTPTEEIREILEMIHDGDITHKEGLGSIEELIGHDEHGHDEHDEHDHGAFDPHIWLDPVLAIQQVMTIRDALVAADPINADDYKDNAAAYIVKLEELHEDYGDTLSNCQYDTMVTFHGAFAYLVERYGFEAVAVAGISGTEEVATAHLIELVEYVRDNNIRHLLGDEVLDQRVLEVIAEETDAEVLTLTPIEGISDEEFKAGATYLDKMRDNLAVLKIALACQ